VNLGALAFVEGKACAKLSLSMRLRLAASEPEVLTNIGNASRHNGTDKLTLRQINRVIKAARAEKTKGR
jgi:hypothetical protein